LSRYFIMIIVGDLFLFLLFNLINTVICTFTKSGNLYALRMNVSDIFIRQILPNHIYFDDVKTKSNLKLTYICFASTTRKLVIGGAPLLISVRIINSFPPTC
jgi:hypothetical protein